MWNILNGTIINAGAVAAGSLAGIFLSHKIPRRHQQIVLNTLGLITIALGIDAAVMVFGQTVGANKASVKTPETYGARLAMVMIGSLVIGSLIGTILRLHDRIEGFGAWVHGRFGSSADSPVGLGAPTVAEEHDRQARGHRFAEGFLTAGVIFCVGPLTLLGCLQNGAEGNPGYLYIKSVLDGFCSMALAAALGWGVFLSVGIVLGFQGGLSILAYYVADPLPLVSRNMMTAVGGVLMLGTALMILEIKKIPVADMLPGLFLPPLFIWLSEAIHPGYLLPAVVP